MKKIVLQPVQGLGDSVLWEVVGSRYGQFADPLVALRCELGLPPEQPCRCAQEGRGVIDLTANAGLLIAYADAQSPLKRGLAVVGGGAR